jgi:hypothetical protein
MLTKISLGLFYLRVSPFQISFRIAVYAVLCVSVINSTLNALGFAWVCQPIEKYWDYSITTGQCINLNQYFLATACLYLAQVAASVASEDWRRFTIDDWVTVS